MYCASGGQGVVPRLSTVPGLGVSEESPERLHDKRVSLIPNTDETLKFVKKKMNSLDSTLSTPRPGAVEGLGNSLSREGVLGVMANQSIGCTVSDAIIRSWQWSTTTTYRSLPLGYFSRIAESL